MIEDNQAQVRLRLDHVAARIGAADPLLAEFVRLWWARAPKDDLLSRSPADDAAATIDSWQFFRRRDPATTYIHIVNPTQAKDGWQSRHTVVRIAAPDMPFVMDSVLMALSHDGLPPCRVQRGPGIGPITRPTSTACEASGTNSTPRSACRRPRR